MRPMFVVARRVLAEDGCQMPFAGDEHAVGAFPSDGAIEATGDEYDAHLAAEYRHFAAGILQELGEPCAGFPDSIGLDEITYPRSTVLDQAALSAPRRSTFAGLRPQ
jgi:hypothetical protein